LTGRFPINDVRNLVAKQLGVDIGFVTSDTHFTNDLGADLLDRVGLMLEIEDQFAGVEITGDDVEAEGVNWLILVRPHQDCTTMSASVLDRRTNDFPHWRGVVVNTTLPRLRWRGHQWVPTGRERHASRYFFPRPERPRSRPIQALVNCGIDFTTSAAGRSQERT
jgi:acyl carrier protein